MKFPSSMIDSVLTLSTAHLRPETAKALNDQDGTIPGHYDIEYGWLFWTFMTEGAEYPPEIAHILRLAAKQSIAYVRFDADGDTVPWLPVWDW